MDKTIIPIKIHTFHSISPFQQYKRIFPIKRMILCKLCDLILQIYHNYHSKDANSDEKSELMVSKRGLHRYLCNPLKESILLSSIT